jgi:hypothetical protein
MEIVLSLQLFQLIFDFLILGRYSIIISFQGVFLSLSIDDLGFPFKLLQFEFMAFSPEFFLLEN